MFCALHEDWLKVLRYFFLVFLCITEDWSKVLNAFDGLICILCSTDSCDVTLFYSKYIFATFVPSVCYFLFFLVIMS